MRMLGAVCQVLSALAAFTAAWFWFRSAQGQAPPATWDMIGEMKPWLDEAASNNRIAATCAGVSAILAGIGSLTGLS
jgi:hypothetical protein